MDTNDPLTNIFKWSGISKELKTEPKNKPAEVYRSIKESDIQLIYSLICEIINPKTKYKTDPLIMAQDVISANYQNAIAVKIVLDKIISPSLSPGA